MSWSAFRNVSLKEEIPPVELVINSNGNNQTTEIKPYSVQDDENSVVKNTLSGTNGLRIDGNGWKSIMVGDSLINPNTVLNFEYISNSEGEIQGIGVDNDNDNSNSINQIFQLFGTQTYGNQAFNDYESGQNWKSYSVGIGQYFTGEINRLTFINDDDSANPVSWSAFRNVSFTNLTTL